MSMRYHLALDVVGGIRNARILKGCITVDGRKLVYVKDIRRFLFEELVQGHRCLPMAECDNFDYQRGCLGHIVDGKDSNRQAETSRPIEAFEDAEDRLAEQCKQCALHDTSTDDDCMNCVQLVEGRWAVTGFKEPK